jgi:hypothetical protein
VRHGCRHVLERQVRRHQRHPQAAAGQHHDHPSGRRPFGQVLGVAAERHAGVVDHPLVHGRGDHGSEFPALATGQRAIEQGQHLARVGGIETTGMGLAASGR